MLEVAASHRMLHQHTMQAGSALDRLLSVSFLGSVYLLIEHKKHLGALPNPKGALITWPHHKLHYKALTLLREGRVLGLRGVWKLSL